MSRPAIKEEWPELEFLCNEVTTLWFEKKLIDGLFSDTEQTIYIMNKGAKEFFASLQSALPLNAIRILTTIYDRQKTGRNSNVTLEGLITQSRMWCDQKTFSECSEMLTNAAGTIGKLRKFRNKRLAHLDRVVAFGGQHHSITIGEFDELSELAANLLNKIQSNLFQSQTAFEQPIANFPHDILNCVMNSLWLRELQRLIRKNYVTMDKVASFISWGTIGSEWIDWCNANEVPPDYFAKPNGIPASLE